ncbi:Hypothetical protein PENO1_104770 [Penicillium occitanis (nom. inval.)]|nr:Hypothetical protein PENO1_104770 [Penicillium occitanis (nom. inval.)]PCG89740.1 hypothetical protein PENOC_105220 [Penicillium occitanis (nom. inval.)]
MAVSPSRRDARHNNPLPFHFPDASSPVPFELKVNEEFLEMTIQKVKRYRPTITLQTEWNTEGPPTHSIAEIAEHWAYKYDWRSTEQKINQAHDHFATTVEGSNGYPKPIPLHFIHHRSPHENAIPLLLLHGWPSSLLEWSKVVKSLTNNDKQPFHIVAPDLPGFGFSPAPKQAGLGPREMGRAFDALMQQLDYKKYGLATTDLGWFTGMWMVHDVQENIIGHMTDFFMAPPNSDDRARLQKGEANVEESSYISAHDRWFECHWAYATTHAQKPAALALALGDSPVGLLGWYWDVNHATSDGYTYSYDRLITDAMMLWIPGPYANIRAYTEFFKPSVMNFPLSKVPTGVSAWGWGNGPFSEIAHFPFAPEAWIKRTANLVYCKKHDGGGHFPAVSQPTAWVEDVREFFAGLK